jgi:putative transcriptional regulator
MSSNPPVRFRLDPANPPKAEWSRLDAMAEDQRQAAAAADPNAQPATDPQLARMRRVPDVAAIRTKLGLDVEGFARRFGLPAALVLDWEAQRRPLDPAAKALLRVIEREPDAAARVAAE